MSNTQPTIRDIAIRLNIAISTVSRALRGAHDVNVETKKAVLEMAKTLHYEPNRVAQSLRIKKTNTLGVVVPEIVMHFFSSAISGIQEYAALHNYSTMICQSIECYETELSNIHMLVGNRVDGLLISLSSETKEFDHLTQLIEKKIPVVMFDRVAENLPVSKVIVDDYEGAFKAVEYLIKTGGKKIAYLGGPENMMISRNRERGYRDALSHYNIKLDQELITHSKDLHNPTEAVNHFINMTVRPDSIFCMNDPMAIHTMMMLKEIDIGIPDEISIVGFTNEPIGKYIEPSLTTIAQPAYELGRVAAKLFLKHINTEGTFEPETIILPTELIVRNSTRKITP